MVRINLAVTFGDGQTTQLTRPDCMRWDILPPTYLEFGNGWKAKLKAVQVDSFDCAMTLQSVASDQIAADLKYLNSQGFV